MFFLVKMLETRRAGGNGPGFDITRYYKGWVYYITSELGRLFIRNKYAKRIDIRLLTDERQKQETTHYISALLNSRGVRAHVVAQNGMLDETKLEEIIYGK